MFKKPFDVQGQNLLSKKDLKALKAQLSESYPALEEKALDELLPDGQVKVLKLDNKSLLYCAGGGDLPPAFFDVEGRGEIFPTLPTLWRNPGMMQELTIHPEVSKYVLNGADLMLPGVLVPANGVAGFGSVTKGQKRCIKIEGNLYPIAVGKMLVNQTQMEKLKGKGLEVVHVYKDTLWAHTGKPVPNAGFSEKEDEVTACNDSSFASGSAVASLVFSPKARPTAASEADEKLLAAGEATPGSATPSSPKRTSEVSKLASDGSTGKAAGDWSQDDLLEFCFLQAFTVSLPDDKSLPVEASELYEKHMKPAKPEGTTLDVKKSSHKQIGKYLNVLRKAKVIDVNEKKGVISVVKVDRTHKGFKQLVDKFASEVGEAAESSASAPAVASGVKDSLPPPKISAIWKPTHYTEVLFKAVGKGKNDLYTWDDAKGMLNAYIEKESLGSSEGAVKLNDELLNALFKTAGAQKKDATWPDEVDFSTLEENLLDRMQEHTVIDVSGVGATTRKGPAVKIEVSLSRKGAHNITRICNLEAYGLDVPALGDELKKKFNCTVTIEDMPGKNSKDKMMQLQGHVDQELETLLFDRYGITKAFLSVK